MTTVKNMTYSTCEALTKDAFEKVFLLIVTNVRPEKAVV